MRGILSTTKDILYNDLPADLHIVRVDLTHHDNVVELSDGSTGVSANYAARHDKKRFREGEAWVKRAEKKEIHLKIFEVDNPDLFIISLQAAILSAYSQHHLVSSLSSAVSNLSIKDVARQGDEVTIVGLGGALKEFGRESKIKRISCTDMFHYLPEDDRVKEAQDGLSDEQKKKLVFGSADKNEEFMGRSDIAFITGCAVCNQTLEDLLRYASSCRLRIVSGHSISMIPDAFFQFGVDIFHTYTYPLNMFKGSEAMSAQEFSKVLKERANPLILVRDDFLTKGLKRKSDMSISGE